MAASSRASAGSLTEMMAYDEDGQLMTGSYMDYALPRASDIPGLGFESHPVPARSNSLGVKGCGEGPDARDRCRR